MQWQPEQRQQTLEARAILVMTLPMLGLDGCCRQVHRRELKGCVWLQKAAEQAAACHRGSGSGREGGDNEQREGKDNTRFDL